MVRLEIKKKGAWYEISRVKISEEPYAVDTKDTTKIWTAHFRINKNGMLQKN